jgi:hypothetical protein
MGLSNEERLEKYYDNLLFFRMDLLALRNSLCDRHTPQHSNEKAAIVDSWIQRVDLLTGRMIRAQDFSGGYWIFGSNETNFRSIYDKHYDLGRQSILDEMRENERNSDTPHAVMDRISFPETARFWTQGQFNHTNGAEQLAFFWDAHSRIAGFLYAVYRYEDNLFPENVKAELLSLFGEMANRRFELISWYGNTYKDVIPSQMEVEQALLCKWKLVIAELTRMDLEDREQTVDKGALLTQVGKMTLSSVKTRLEELESAEWERKSKYGSKEEGLSFSGVMGPQARTKKELEKILETSDNLEECEIADKEMGTVYSSYWGGWRTRFEAPKNKSKKPVRKTKPSRKQRPKKV